MAKARAKYAPETKPAVKPQPPQYAIDTPLRPLQTRPKIHRWMEPPDVTPAVGICEPDTGREFVPWEHAGKPHEMLQHVPLADRTYARYPPGTGPFFGGPTYSRRKRGAASDTAQFVIVVVALSLAPLLVDLARVTLLCRRGVGASLASWTLAAVAVCCLGVGFFKTARRPFTRWLMRVACAVGVNEKDADVVVAGVAFVTGATGCLLTYSSSVAIRWLLVGRGWGTFLLSLAAAAAAVGFHEHRVVQRARFKRVLTVFYDAEKDAEGLNALMGRASDVDRSRQSFAVSTPQWLRYQDQELVNWLNVFLARTWPFQNRALCSAIKAEVEPLLEEKRPKIFSKLHFGALDLGTVPVQIRYVKFLGAKSDAMGLSLEVDLAWAGRSRIMLNAVTLMGNTLTFGVKDVEMYAKVQVTLQPLMPSPPPFGGVIISLAEKPLFDFDIDLPLGMEGTVSTALQEWLEKFMSETLGDRLVWPERVVVPLARDDAPVTVPSGKTVTHKWYADNVLRLRNTGIVCVTAKRASHVPSSDLLSKSDAYMRLHIKGPTHTKTEVIMNNNHPVWDESVYLLVDDVFARKLTVQIMDSDEGDVVVGSDDVIGETTLSLADLQPNETRDVRLEFPETAKRNARSKKPPMTADLDITYFPFDDKKGVDGGESSSALAGVGMLTCRLIRGAGLKSADYNGFSDPFCKVFMEKAWLSKAENKKKQADVIKFKSKVVKKTLNPEWNEMYEFVGVRKSSLLHVECYDRDVGYVANSKDSLGSFKVDLVEIFDGKDAGETEREFNLQGDKTIKGTITLQLAWQTFEF